jgi:hypothetical protein
MIFKHLFNLNGFDDLCHPQLLDGKFSCDFNSNSYKFRYNDAERLLNRIKWIFSFPTAYNAWKSVYKFSRDGTIGVALPDADITCLLHGSRIANSVFINRIRILTVNPTEDTVNWAKMEKKEFRFNLETRSPHSDVNLIRKDGTSRLLDSEWDEIQKILYTYFDRTPRITRTRIDSILQKLTTGVLWTEIENGLLIQSVYRKLRRDNLWPKIETLLLMHRRKLPARVKNSS